MKAILLFLTVAFLMACNGTAQKANNTRGFVKLSPGRGTIQSLMVQGQFGTSVITETYFLSFIEEDSPLIDSAKRVHLEEGFVVAKLKRYPSDKKNLAYKLLDSLNESKRALNMDIGPDSNWSKEEKEHWLLFRRIGQDISVRFYNHVKWYVEKESLKTGISRMAFLSYEN